MQLSLAFSGEGRKARGAFFTPEALADFLAGWAVRKPTDRILDPSCGEASLLIAAGRRLRALGGKGKVHGLDVHPPSIDAARQILDEEGFKSELRAGDFFDEEPQGRFDAVIGNPPYIRYQSFTGKDRIKAQKAAFAQGVRLSGLANAWAAFVVHASQFLKKDGRLALVLPAVLLSVNYAAPVRGFLLSHFRSVKLVLFEERVFPDVMEEVVLLLAEGLGSTQQFDVFQVKDLRGLEAITGMPAAEARPWTPTEADDKWTEALLPPEAAEIYASLATSPHFSELLTWGETDLGMVTGNNRYFTMTADDVVRIGLPSTEVRRISPPGSRHLRGLELSHRTFEALARDGQRVYLFCPDRDRPSRAARRYIELGEQQRVQAAYKCAVRSPWWAVPSVRIPDLFLTYMNQDTPRLVANQAAAAHLNSVHGVTLHGEHRQLGMELLPLAMLNSITMLGAELVGRSYGGGILKIEPKEADRLPMPSPDVVAEAAEGLRKLRPQLAKQLRNSQLSKVAKAVDEVLLEEQLRLGRHEIAILVEARRMMEARRSARAGKPREEGRHQRHAPHSAGQPARRSGVDRR